MVERHLISSGSPWELTVGYSRAVRVGDRVFVAGTAPKFDDESTCTDDPELQARRCLEIIETALIDAGSSLADVVRTRIYLIDPGDFDGVALVHGELFHDIRPANTTVVVSALLDPAWKVEIEVEAVVAGDRSPAH